MHIETLAVHAAQRPDPVTGAIAPPISLSTTFERDPSGAYSRGFEYSRDANPNRAALEEAMALLEGGEAAAAFSSGMAAATAVFQALAPGVPRCAGLVSLACAISSRCGSRVRPEPE